ncbi:MAG: GGDEF domain-containing protein [Spirochaetota bacterium]
MATISNGVRGLLRANIAGALLALVSSLLGAAGYALLGLPGALGALLASAALGALLVGKLTGPAETTPEAVSAPVVETAVATPIAPMAPSVPPPDRIDSLTGLANENGLNAWFSERLPRHVEDRKGIAIFSASLDGFDAIVRSRGQAVADKVLIEVAKRVALFAGAEDVAARTGGGEFATIATVVSDQSAEVAADIAAKIAEMLQRPVELPEGVIWIGGMVGAAAGPASEGLGVLKRARSALERAKPLGPGQYVVDKV